MNKALTFTDGHICRRNPTEAARFCVESSLDGALYFRGLLSVRTHIAIENGSNNDTEECSLQKIKVELHYQKRNADFVANSLQV